MKLSNFFSDSASLLLGSAELLRLEPEPDELVGLGVLRDGAKG